MRVYKCGSLYLRQVEGIPIGGPISMSILDTVLSRCEYMFDKYGWRYYSRKYNLKGKREHWVTIGRYVDDVLAVSHWLCEKCLKELVELVHAGMVSFDPACDDVSCVREFRVIRYLDLWMFFSWNSFIFNIVNKNDEDAETDSESI